MGDPSGPHVGPLSAPQETPGQSPVPASPGPPAGLKPTLAERLAAMADKHPVYTEPPEPENPPSEDEAEANVVAAMDPAWVRRFHRHVDTDGSTVYVDPDTGQTYAEIPPMHSTDGRDT